MLGDRGPLDIRAGPAPSPMPPAPAPTPAGIAPATPGTTDAMTTRDQLLQAEEYLGTLRSDRAESCRELEEESKVFLESPASADQERRFRLIYQLLRYQVLRIL